MTESPCCPACIDSPPLRPLDLHGGLRVPLRRCDACLGIWADARSAAVAAQHYDRSHYVMVAGHGARTCRACGRVLSGLSAACTDCKHDQRLRCVGCRCTMAIVEVGGIVLDVCRPCKSVWFDRGELGLIAQRFGAELMEQVRAPRNAIADGGTAGEFALDALSEPDVLFDVAAGAGRVALETGVAVGEAASVVVGALVDILGAVLDD